MYCKMQLAGVQVTADFIREDMEARFAQIVTAAPADFGGDGDVMRALVHIMESWAMLAIGGASVNNMLGPQLGTMLCKERCRAGGACVLVRAVGGVARWGLDGCWESGCSLGCQRRSCTDFLLPPSLCWPSNVTRPVAHLNRHPALLDHAALRIHRLRPLAFPSPPSPPPAACCTTPGPLRPSLAPSLSRSPASGEGRAWVAGRLGQVTRAVVGLVACRPGARLSFQPAAPTYRLPPDAPLQPG